MVKSILITINKKRFVVEMPMPLARMQSKYLSFFHIRQYLQKISVIFYQRQTTIVSNKILTLKDLKHKSVDVEIQ